MRRVTWACFDCHKSVRRQLLMLRLPGDTPSAVLCPSCGKPCRYVGYRLRLPPKADSKAWSEMLDLLRLEAFARVEADKARRLADVRWLLTEIDRLEGKGPNEGRAKQVRLLRKRLEKLQGPNKALHRTA